LVEPVKFTFRTRGSAMRAATITTVLPTASGMAMDRMPSTSGAFHGEIVPTTPRGIRWAIE
jgi:hypothetical protein